jgi:hypothetical protein
MTIDFKFNVDEKVTIIPTGVTGMIGSCAVDNAEGHKSYYVKTAQMSDWWDEKFLEPVKEAAHG